MILFPEEAATRAADTDFVFLIFVAISIGIIAIVVTLIVVFSLRYRKGTQAKRGPIAKFYSHEFEIGWTTAIFFLAMFLFWWSAAVRVDLFVAPPNSMQVHVAGKQWMWKIEHANGAREINTLHAPVHVPVQLIMTSEDVIHSFFVPNFRMKMDVVPGRYTQTWFEATRLGQYQIFCAQFCGTEHARMIGTVVVMSQADFAKWLRAQPEADNLAREGQALFVSLGCAGCHAARSAVHAPRLDGVYGSPVHLSNGQVVIADDGYIRDSILQPDKDVVAGFKSIMPSFKGLVSDSQILRLTAYIRSLKNQGKS